MNDHHVCHAKSSPRAALTWSTIAFFGGFAGVSAFGPIVPTLKQTMSLSPLLMGLLAASSALTGSLLRIPFGAMVDRTGGKKPILILLGMALLGVAGITLMFGLFPSPRTVHCPAFRLFGILSGCGIAVFSVGIPSVSYWYPQRAQGAALAIYAGLGNLAPGLFALLLTATVVWLGFTISYVRLHCRSYRGRKNHLNLLYDRSWRGPVDDAFRPVDRHGGIRCRSPGPGYGVCQCRRLQTGAHIQPGRSRWGSRYCRWGRCLRRVCPAAIDGDVRKVQWLGRIRPGLQRVSGNDPFGHRIDRFIDPPGASRRRNDSLKHY
jgi:hypothetical protein